MHLRLSMTLPHSTPRSIAGLLWGPGHTHADSSSAVPDSSRLLGAGDVELQMT